jgi:hypothetical protein
MRSLGVRSMSVGKSGEPTALAAGVSLTSYSHMVQREPVLGGGGGASLSEGSARLLPASGRVSLLRNTTV